MDAFVTWYQLHLAGIISPKIFVSIISMVPIVELRGGIIVARLLKLSLGQAIFYSFIGNIIPIPFILLFLRKIFDWMRPTKLFGGLVRKMEERAHKKSSGVEKAEFFGLVGFVGIPLPGTWGWTGALISSVLEIDIKKASLAILIGLVLASTIVSFISYGVFHM